MQIHKDLMDVLFRICVLSFATFLYDFFEDLRYENFSVDMKDAGKNRSDLESLTEFLDRCDRVWASANAQPD